MSEYPAAFVFALALAWGCTPPASPSAPPTPRRGDAVAIPSVAIRYQRAAPNRWRADYTFSHAVSVALFAESNDTVRSGWRVLGEEIRITSSKDGDVVVAKNPFRALSIDIPITDRTPDGAYRDFYPYTDRGILAYMGHLVVTSAPCVGPPSCDAGSIEPSPPMNGTITIAGGRETVLVRGQAPASEVTIPMSGASTYAYVGSLEPAETADYVGVVDRGYPPWLRDRLDGLIPKLFRHYADTLGRPAKAADKPLLFATFGLRDGAKPSLGGSVVPPRVVTFAFELVPKSVDVADGGLRSEIELIVAHEVAHLWNADLHPHTRTRESSWLWEGGAEALAVRALRATGAIDHERYRELLSNQVSLCVLRLADGTPLSAAATRRGGWRAFYECGATVALVTEGALKKKGGNAELTTFWRALFEASNERPYDEAVYYEMLDRLVGDPLTTDFVRRLTQAKLGDPAIEIRQALERAGIQTTITTTLSTDYEARAGVDALRALLPATCSSALELEGNLAVIPRIARGGACGRTAAGDVVRSVEGIDIAINGASAHDRAFARCRREGKLDFGIEGKGTVTVGCAERPQPRPPFLAVTP